MTIYLNTIKYISSLFSGKNFEHVQVNHNNEHELVRLFRKTRDMKNLKIHLGCGPRVLKGWINIDLAYEPYANYLKYYTNKYYGKDVRGKKSDFYAIDITKQPLPLRNSSTSIVFHEDFIEHLDQKHQYLLLAEIWRILKRGGVHRINTPDIISSMRLNSKFKLGYLGVYQSEWDKHIHKNVLSVESLREMALLVGYSKVIVQKRDQSKANIPREYRPDPNDRLETGNIFIDLIK